jgi:Family of unknown function (DUF695)
MSASTPRDLISWDHWAIAETAAPPRLGIIRFRTPVLGSDQVKGYPRCLRILWAYADEGSGALPDDPTTQRLQTFENRLVEALERDAVAVLTAVLTFDGARQWVFYTADGNRCAARIEELPREQDPYPIDIDVFDDPEWRYLRDEILATVPYDT